MGGFVFGKRGSGKSTYCYKLGGKIYYTLNGYNNKDDEEDAYKIAIEHMIFDPVVLRTLLIKNKIKKEITPYVCLDDASMHFGNTLHQTNPPLYAALRAETATIRTAITGFVINAPKRSHVAKCLRDYDDYKGECLVDAGGGGTSNDEAIQEHWNRKIRFYMWRWYPDEKKYNIKIPFQDKYSCFIPEPFYSWYIEKKNFFEIKYEIQVADKIDTSTRGIFILLNNELPSYPNQPNLKHIVEKWERQDKEEVEEMKRVQEKKKDDVIRDRLRKADLKKLVDKLLDENQG